MTSFNKKILSAVLFFCFFPLSATTQNSINHEVFDTVVKEISHRHFDGQFRQKYAQKISKFRQIALKSVNNNELAVNINAFLHELPDSHMGIIPPPDQKSSSFAILQNDVILMESDGKVFVYDCPVSSKFKKGDELLSVNNNKGDKFSRIGRAIQLKLLLSTYIPDFNMPVEVRRDGKIIKFTHTTRRAKQLPRFFKLGEMPPHEDSYKSELLNDDTAYICFNIFTPYAIQSFKKDIHSHFKNVPKLIIDLRNNVGGLIMMGVNMASFLSSKRISFGEITNTGSKLTPKSYPQDDRYRGKVFILIGRNTYSTAELFALAMQEAGEAVIIGEKSPGVCLPSVFISMPHGFRLQTVMGDYISSKGYRIEAKGVIPDVTIKLDSISLKKGRDAILEHVLKNK